MQQWKFLGISFLGEHLLVAVNCCANLDRTYNVQISLNSKINAYATLGLYSEAKCIFQEMQDWARCRLVLLSRADQSIHGG